MPEATDANVQNARTMAADFDLLEYIIRNAPFVISKANSPSPEVQADPGQVTGSG